MTQILAGYIILDSQKFGARIQHGAITINPKLILFIYGFVFQSTFIYFLKGKIYKDLGNLLTQKALSKL